jgi:hypothetical protein
VEHSEALNSWKEISNYIGRGVRTVQRWEKDFGLPVRRPGGHLRGSVFALKTEIDQWLGSRSAREAERSNSRDLRAERGLRREKFELLHANTERLIKNCTRLATSAERLNNNLRQIEQLRARRQEVKSFPLSNAS